MRICLLSNAAGVHTSRIARSLVDKDHEVHVITLTPGAIEGVTVHHVRWWPKWKQVGYLSTVPRVRRLIRDISPDVLHAHYAISYGIIGALTGFRPFVISAWGSDILVSPGNSRTRWGVLRWALRHADLVTSVADHISAKLVDNGVPKSRILTVPFGADSRLFGRGLSDDQPREVDVICTRNLDQVYNVELLLRALPVILTSRPGLKCILAGDGDQKASLTALAERLGVGHNIQWLGWITPRELALQLRRSKVYVSPALSDGASTSLFEAMFCGCFPVAVDIPANRSWITNGETGFLVPADQPRELARRILSALASETLRQAAAEINSKLVSDRADLSNNIGQIEQHYLRLARRPTIESSPVPNTVDGFDD